MDIIRSITNSYQSARVWLQTKITFRAEQRKCIKQLFQQVAVVWGDRYSSDELRSMKIALIRGLVSSKIKNQSMEQFANQVKDVAWPLFASLVLNRYVSTYTKKDELESASTKPNWKERLDQSRQKNWAPEIQSYLANRHFRWISRQIEADLRKLPPKCPCSQVLFILLAKYHLDLAKCTPSGALTRADLFFMFQGILLLQTTDQLKEAIRFFENYQKDSHSEEAEFVPNKMQSWADALKLFETTTNKTP